MNHKQGVSTVAICLLFVLLTAAVSPSAAAPLLQVTVTPALTPAATGIPETALPTMEPEGLPEAEPVALPTAEPITVYMTLEPEGQVAAVRYEVSAGDVLIAGILFAQLVVLLVSLAVSLAERHTRR